MLIHRWVTFPLEENGLELIEISGHVPGHQSVLVRLPRTGPVLLAIDAVPMQNGFTPDRQGSPMDADGAGAIAANCLRWHSGSTSHKSSSGMTVSNGQCLKNSLTISTNRQ